MKNIHQEKPILKAVEHLTNHKRDVLICEPKTQGDFNDIAQKYGRDGVMQSLINGFSLTINTALDGRIDVKNLQNR